MNHGLSIFFKKSKKGSLPLCQAKTTTKTKLHHYQLSYSSIKNLNLFGFNSFGGRDSTDGKADGNKETEQRACPLRDHNPEVEGSRPVVNAVHTGDLEHIF